MNEDDEFLRGKAAPELGNLKGDVMQQVKYILIYILISLVVAIVGVGIFLLLQSAISWIAEGILAGAILYISRPYIEKIVKKELKMEG
jgi:hypothetical protein